ncbi:UbiA family prenyltransferase [Ekhidna sp.]
MKKSTLLHLRIPFSFYLLPVFLLALAVSGQVDQGNFWISFLILHLLVYPASNGYNSYFDKDEDSIGGLKNPPKVSKELYGVSIAMDIIALIGAFAISLEFALMIFIYGAISKAYSHPSIRLKKYPVIGWLAAGIFQGYWTFILSYIAVTNTNLADVWVASVQIPGALSTFLLLGSYPMTQIYQHEEDTKRGDVTISKKLGILGTFHFTAVAFMFSSTGFFYFFMKEFSLNAAILFGIAMFPVLTYFSYWYLQVRKNTLAANFSSTMRLNFISALMLNSYFIYLWLS